MTYEPTQKEKSDCWDAYCAEPETLIDCVVIGSDWERSGQHRRKQLDFRSEWLFRIHQPEPTEETTMPKPTEEQLQDLAKAIQAPPGAIIQWRDLELAEWSEGRRDKMAFNNTEDCHYRRKPEPEYRPYTLSELCELMESGELVVIDGTEKAIAGVRQSHGSIPEARCLDGINAVTWAWRSASELLDHGKHSDGTPFGKAME